MKLNLSKAYDRVDGSFLFKILESFGFGKRCIVLISQLVSMASMVVLVNGSSSNFFTHSRGLRQADPISPILFIIMDECLGRYINQLTIQGSVHGLIPSSQLNACSHEQFVDDMILMGIATIKEARNQRNTLNIYIKASGQLINWEKSSILFLNTPLERQNKIAIIWGCTIASFPGLYLGLPFDSNLLNTFQEMLIDKYNKKPTGWKGSLLSQVSKVVLLKSSLQSLHIYALSLFKMPIKYVDAMERMQRNFLWTRIKIKKRLPLISWDSICKPKNQWGVGHQTNM